MGQLTSTLLVRLIDGISGPARGAAASLRGLGRVASGFRGGIGSVLDDNAKAAGRFRNQLLGITATAAVVGFALKRAFGEPISKSLAFETTLEDIGQKADLAGTGLQRLGERIRAIGTQTGRTAQETAGTVDTLLGLGLGGKTNEEDVSNALGMLPAINKTATAYRAASDDIARAGQAVFANLKVPSNQVIKAFDAMAASGKEGAFELRDMARYFPSITALGQNLGIKGVKGAADLAAALQVVRQGAGNAEEAATNLINVLQKAGTPTTQKAFKKMGINFREEMKKLTKRGMSPIEAMVETTRKAMAKGATIGDLFEDRQAQLGMLALLQDTERYRKIREQALSASGMVEADFARRIQTSQAAFDRFRASAENLQIAIGNKVMPVVTTFLDSFTQGLNTLDQRVSIFDRIGKAIGGFASGMGFGGITDLKTALDTLMNLVLGNMSSFDQDTDQLAVIFGRFRTMGQACRELASGINDLTEPLLKFFGTDWGDILGWAATIGGAALAIATFTASVRALAGALYFLSGARAGVAVLSAVAGAAGLTGASAAAGAGVAGAAGAVGATAASGSLARTLATKAGMYGLAIAAGLAVADHIPHPEVLDQTPAQLWEKMKGGSPAMPTALPEHGYGGNSTNTLDPAAIERSRRAQDEFKADPEGARGRALMDLQSKADQTKTSLEEVSDVNVAPTVDTTSLDQAIAKARELQGALNGINNTKVQAPSLGQGLRGIHADTGVE
jgi:TP901 family phage tail tape measure protein